MSNGYLSLKWGTIKGCRVTTERAREALREYHEIGVSMSAALQNNTPRQRELICVLIDECEDEHGIFLEWNDTHITKDEAKRYVMEYGSEKP